MLFHLIIATVAVISILLLKGLNFFSFQSLANLTTSLLIGAGIGLCFQICYRSISQRFSWTSKMDSHLAVHFEGMVIGEIFFLALISSISEELLFRALIQPYLGLWLTSLLFGLAHWTGKRELLVWPFLAFFAGLMLGELSEQPAIGVTGATSAHFIINFLGLWHLSKARKNSALKTFSSDENPIPDPTSPREIEDR